jgi:hypothetical protein
MLFYIRYSKESLALSDEIVFLGATLIILATLWWKRMYAHPAYRFLLTPLILFAMFIASWIRHGHYTGVYGILCAALAILSIISLYLNKGAALEDEDDQAGGHVPGDLTKPR